MPPPPPPPPPPPAYSSHGYYTSSDAARAKLGLSAGSSKYQQQTTAAAGAGGSSSSDDWFNSPAAPAPKQAPASGSGFYSSSSGGGGNAASNSNSYSSYSAYGGGASSTTPSNAGYYGASSSGYQSGGMTSAEPASSHVPPASAFGSNPNSGSSSSMSGHMGGGNAMSGSMSGAMGGPIGGSMPQQQQQQTQPQQQTNVFDPNAMLAQAAMSAASKALNDSIGPADQGYFEDYENEPPLLEELGVNFPHIYSKSRAVLFPIGKHAKSLESGFIENDADLAGPLAFALGLGGELLLSGKMHFGYVYGFGMSGCAAMTLLLNLLNPNGAVSMWTVISILGYALLPVNLLAGINVLIRVHKLGVWGMVMAVLAICWCTMASTRLFERGCNMRAQRFLVAYPAALLYSAFVMLTIF